VHKMLAEFRLIPGLNNLFDKLIWRKYTASNHVVHGQNENCDCSPVLAGKGSGKLSQRSNILRRSNENVSCLNTSLVILMLARRKAKLPFYLNALREKEYTEKYPGCLLNNFHNLLRFWQRHYLNKDKDSTCLENVSSPSFAGISLYCLYCSHDAVVQGCNPEDIYGPWNNFAWPLAVVQEGSLQQMELMLIETIIVCRDKVVNYKFISWNRNWLNTSSCIPFSYWKETVSVLLGSDRTSHCAIVSYIDEPFMDLDRDFLED
ncbi:hypothetical protein GOODEAATRI_006343, partial [Goodea atripinnis]